MQSSKRTHAPWRSIAAMLFPTIWIFVSIQKLTALDFFDDWMVAWEHFHDPVHPVETCLTLPDPLSNPNTVGHAIFIAGYSFQSVVKYRTTHVWTNVAYYPQYFGDVQSIDWRMRYNTVVGSHIINLLLKQGSTYYWVPSAEEPQVFSGWRSIRRSIPVSSFVRMEGPGPTNPDFSHCGDPVHMGYVAYNTSPWGITDGGTNSLSAGEVVTAEFGVTWHSDATAAVIQTPVFISPTKLRLVWEGKACAFYEVLARENLDAGSWSILGTVQAERTQSSVDIEVGNLPSLFLEVREVRLGN